MGLEYRKDKRKERKHVYFSSSLLHALTLITEYINGGKIREL